MTRGKGKRGCRRRATGGLGVERQSVRGCARGGALRNRARKLRSRTYRSSFSFCRRSGRRVPCHRKLDKLVAVSRAYLVVGIRGDFSNVIVARRQDSFRSAALHVPSAATCTSRASLDWSLLPDGSCVRFCGLAVLYASHRVSCQHGRSECHPSRCERRGGMLHDRSRCTVVVDR